MTARLRGAAVAFGRFWWDFLVGDTPEMLLGVVFIVIVALALRSERVAVVVILPLCVVALLGLSTLRGRVRSHSGG